MLMAFSVWPSSGAARAFFHAVVAAAVNVVRTSSLPNRTDSIVIVGVLNHAVQRDVLHDSELSHVSRCALSLGFICCEQA